MVAHLTLASYVVILRYHLVYSGAIGNWCRVSNAAIGAVAADCRVACGLCVDQRRILLLERQSAMRAANKGFLLLSQVPRAQRKAVLPMQMPTYIKP